MLLLDQVELLREHLEHLRDQQFALPLTGGQFATRQTYQFRSLLHPARDIATTIARADPRGERLPSRLRGWNLDASDEYGISRKVCLKRLLGMVIHVYYLRVGEGNLDVSNDRGERVVVPYQAFLDSVKRLDRSTTVRADCQTIDDTPFIMGAQVTGTTPSWHVGWRRGDAYAQSWMEISHLTGAIQECFSD